MTKLKEAIRAAAKQAVEYQGYVGNVEHDSEIVAEIIYRAVVEHNNQYNVRSAITKENQ